MNMIGEKGDPVEVSKVITVKMYDNYYEPNKFEIKKNQSHYDRTTIAKSHFSIQIIRE